MELFIYDNKTKEYRGKEKQFLDPVESKKSGKDVYIKTTNSTSLTPPTTLKNETSIFENEKWLKVPDFREEIYFNITDATQVIFNLKDTVTRAMTKKDPLAFISPIWDSAKSKWKENMSLDGTKISKFIDLENSFNNDTLKITTALPHEMTSWGKQVSQARAWVADNTVLTPFIDNLLTARSLGETKEILVGKIIANADAYEIAYAKLLGKFQKLTRQVEDATTVEEIDAIMW